MTTIVYSKEKHALYADSRTSDGSGFIVDDDSEKIVVLNNGDVACLAGALSTIQYVEDNWPDIRAEKLGDGVQGFIYCVAKDVVIVIAGDVDYEAGQAYFSQWRADNTRAYGSGRDLATAAMDLGLDPVEAIEYAATRDTGTNNRVTMLDLREYREKLTNETD